ncbi:hypothetical protein [Nocardiopsis synnemataformans]|uniref:hypothetical protein n=1 Tax=Nocardiopsis synnemataformans TaxID=61305 RepID=UPI003EBE2AC2
MSTRGAIAVPATSGKGWWGRYHHYDAHPLGLGRELFHLYHDTFGRDHEAMAKVLVKDHPAGWSTVVRPYTPQVFERADFEQAGFRDLNDPDFDLYPLCYCHGRREETEQILTCRCPSDPEGCAPVFIEWAYTITKAGMFVATSWHPDPGAGQAFVHRPVAFVDWDRTTEPDWREAQQRARLIDVPDLTL